MQGAEDWQQERKLHLEKATSGFSISSNELTD